MRLICFHLLLFILFASSVSAQINGRIIDQTGAALPFVNVVLHQAADTSFISGTHSDDQGIFELAIPHTGRFIIGLSSIGQQPFFSNPVEIKSTSTRLDLGDLQLQEAVNDLQGVEISAKKDLIQITPLGKVINVQASMMSKGNSALQILERIPGLSIDYRNNTLMLNGQSGVSVLLNGRPLRLPIGELMAMLSGMSGDNIEKIELITSPTAQYDAEGGAGLINIVLKKNTNEGTQLSLNSSLGYGWREKASTSLNLMHSHKNLSYQLGYAFLHDGSISNWHAIGTQNVPSLGGYNVADFYSATEDRKNAHNFSLGFDQKIDAKTLWGGQLNYASTNTRPEVFNDATYDFSDGLHLHLLLNSKGNSLWRNAQTALFLEKQLAPHSKLNLDLSYLDFKNDNPNLINTTYRDENEQEIQPDGRVFTQGNRGSSLSKIKIGVFKADFSHQIKEHLSVDMGLKGSFSHNENNSKIESRENGEWVLDPRSQSYLVGTEGIVAAYSSFNWRIHAKTSLTGGLRYEFWRRTFNDQQDARQFSQLFPSLHFSHKPSEASTLVLNYTRRISRPAYNDLATNLIYNDPISVFTGNPTLKPTLSQALKLEFSLKGKSIGLVFQRDENPIVRYQISTNPAQEIYLVSPQNMAYQNSINLNGNFPIQISKSWKLSVGTTLAHRKFQLTHTPQMATHSYWAYNYSINQSLKLPRNYELELNAWHNGSQYDGATRVSGFGMLNLGIGKKLNRNRGTLQLTVTDLLKTMRLSAYIGHLTPLVFQLRSVSNYRSESAWARIFRLSYSRNFGNVLNKQERKSGSDEERERVGQ